MFGLGALELTIILVLVLVVFGAGKLPQVGESLGKGLNKFKHAMDDKETPDTKPESTVIDAEKKKDVISH
ncbi:MAG: twin-arginine translocase TatA/TatE family subunit [Mariprofundaceae bacterium]|nr:twin-arginine translocase TatA/TatE family subunit [Mariprofundaceae bacterium]